MPREFREDILRRSRRRSPSDGVEPPMQAGRNARSTRASCVCVCICVCICVCACVWVRGCVGTGTGTGIPQGGAAAVLLAHDRIYQTPASKKKKTLAHRPRVFLPRACQSLQVRVRALDHLNQRDATPVDPVCKAARELCTCPKVLSKGEVRGTCARGGHFFLVGQSEVW